MGCGCNSNGNGNGQQQAAATVYASPGVAYYNQGTLASRQAASVDATAIEGASNMDQQMTTTMARLESIYRADPARGRAEMMKLIAYGIAAQSGNRVPASILRSPSGRGVDVGVGQECSSRDYLLPCVPPEDECIVKDSSCPGVLVTVGTVQEVDFDRVRSVDQLLYNLKYLQMTGDKDVTAVSGTPTAGALNLTLRTGLCIGYAIKWSVGNYLSNPIVVNLATTNVVAADGATARNRSNIQVELPERTNGGWIYMPGAYRATAGMDLAEAQLVQAHTGPDGTLAITGSSDDITWSVRKMSAFTTWTIDFLNILVGRVLGK